MTARQEIERIAAEHRGATDRLVERIAATTRTAALRSAAIRRQPVESTHPADTAPALDSQVEEPDRPSSWLM